MHDRKPGLKPLVTYLVLVFAFSAIMFFVMLTGRGDANSVLVLMWCPAAAAIITALVYYRSLRSLGWKWGQSRWQAAAYLTPVACPTVAYAFIWATGLGGINASFSPVAPFVGPTNFIVFAIVGSLWSLVSATGEEIGWRGFLVPGLRKRTSSFTAVALISGAIWALWHFPLIVGAGYNQGGPVWFTLLMFTVQVLSAATITAWLRLKSGSLWTAALYHASHNFWVQNFFSPMTTDRGMTNLLGGEFGLATSVMLVIAAVIFWKFRRRLPADEKGTAPAAAGTASPAGA